MRFISQRLSLSASAFAIAIAATSTSAAAQTEEQQVDAAQTAEACAELDGADRDACLTAQGTAPPPGDAQEEGAIVVTGSRIPRANFDTAQPAVVIGSEQIEARGYTNLGDALDELPAFGVPGNNPVGGQTGAFGAGQTFINFFGLGDQRTLTVVNGRRFVSSNTASIFGVTGAGSQVDFNIIPTMIVDRVETIAVGGAPIYGSDAIAGTVNILTKRTFDGVRLDAQYGISEMGDGREYRLGALAGKSFAGGRGNVVAAFEYNKSAGLKGTDRPNAGLGRFFTNCANPDGPAQCLIEDRTLPALSEFGLPTVGDNFFYSPAEAAAYSVYSPYYYAPEGTPFTFAIQDPAGNYLRFDPNGNLIPTNFGEATGDGLNYNGGNGFRLPENLLTETRRYLATVQAQYELGDTLRVFGEAWYANSRGNQLADQPVYNTRLFGTAGTTDGNLIVNLNNPFLKPAARAAIAASIANNQLSDQNITRNSGADPDFVQDYFYLGRANTDLIPGDGSSTVELYRFVAGLDGKFQALGREMTFEVVGNYGKSTLQGRERVLLQQNFENAVNAVTNSAGQIVCAPGAVNAAIPAINPNCAPINPFGQQISQQAIDYVTTFADPRAENDQWVGTASLSGSLFDLWGGPVGFAVGYEHREESAAFTPGAYYLGAVDPADPTGARIPYGRSVPIDPVSGKFNTDEVFGELTLPIIGRDQNIPFIRTLELNGAIRYIDHSLAGADLTWTAGAQFQPIEDITFRGNFTRSVRAPAITELFNPTSQIFTTANDPCDAQFIDAGPNPETRQANCQAAGIGDGFSSDITKFTVKGTLQGNTQLTNEIADAWTVGAILRPRFLPGFTLAVDWVDIELQNAIQSLDATQTLQACYDDPNYPTAICDQFTRDEDGQITFIQTGYANAASRNFQGLIAELAYRMQTPFLGTGSSLNLSVNYLYNDELEFRVGQGDLTTLRGTIGYSKHQATTNLTYKNDGFTGQVQAQYIGPAVFDADEEPDNRDFPGVDGVTFFNASLQYAVNERFGVRFIVDNVLNTKPPFPSPGGGGRVTYFEGIMGRYFKVGAQVKF
jgi:outer membrane receptor protein involved in Fe transport